LLSAISKIRLSALHCLPKISLIHDVVSIEDGPCFAAAYRHGYALICALADVMVLKGVPEHLRSENGPKFVARDLREWLARTGAKTLYIEPGSPWENGYCESFNSKLRDEFLNGEIFYSMKELRVPAERWRVHYNTVRPHSSLGYRPPAPEAWLASSKTWHGEVETATRFPLLHTPDRGYLSSEITALH
jgi:putative transposase